MFNFCPTWIKSSTRFSILFENDMISILRCSTHKHLISAAFYSIRRASRCSWTGRLRLVRCFLHWLQKLLKRSYVEQVLCMSPQTNSVHTMSPVLHFLCMNAWREWEVATTSKISPIRCALQAVLQARRCRQIEAQAASTIKQGWRMPSLTKEYCFKRVYLTLSLGILTSSWPTIFCHHNTS